MLLVIPILKISNDTKKVFKILWKNKDCEWIRKSFKKDAYLVLLFHRVGMCQYLYLWKGKSKEGRRSLFEYKIKHWFVSDKQQKYVLSRRIEKVHTHNENMWAPRMSDFTSDLLCTFDMVLQIKMDSTPFPSTPASMLMHNFQSFHSHTLTDSPRVSFPCWSGGLATGDRAAITYKCLQTDCRTQYNACTQTCMRTILLSQDFPNNW